jgi:glutamine amidotransferase
MITIVNYGLGNIGSVANMLAKLGASVRIVDEPKGLRDAKKLLLPGVGAFDAAMKRLENTGMREVLNERVLTERVPILGICLGMQVLLSSSEEGASAGLGWIPGQVKRFIPRPQESLRVPHMGWNTVAQVRLSPLTADLPNPSRFYFVHSYYAQPFDETNVIMRTTNGQDFASVIGNGSNIFGVQFHPEKSHGYGKAILRNFLNI